MHIRDICLNKLASLYYTFDTNLNPLSSMVFHESLDYWSLCLPFLTGQNILHCCSPAASAYLLTFLWSCDPTCSHPFLQVFYRHLTICHPSPTLFFVLLCISYRNSKVLWLQFKLSNFWSITSQKILASSPCAAVGI